jgi:hypothetical protein
MQTDQFLALLAEGRSVRLLAKAFGVDGIDDFLAGEHVRPCRAAPAGSILLRPTAVLGRT